MVHLAADRLWWLLKRQRQSEQLFLKSSSLSVHGGSHQPHRHPAKHLDDTGAPRWTDGDLFKRPTVILLLVQASHGSMYLSPRTILAGLSCSEYEKHLRADVLKTFTCLQTVESLSDSQRMVESRRRRCKGKILRRPV